MKQLTPYKSIFKEATYERLEKGKKYDLSNLIFKGWIDPGPGANLGKQVRYYGGDWKDFFIDGTYIGPDYSDKVEPVFSFGKNSVVTVGELIKKDIKKSNVNFIEYHPHQIHLDSLFHNTHLTDIKWAIPFQNGSGPFIGQMIIDDYQAYVMVSGLNGFLVYIIYYNTEERLYYTSTIFDIKKRNIISKLTYHSNQEELKRLGVRFIKTSKG